MKLLLDTHAFIWMLEAPEKLSERVIKAHNDSTNTLYLSVASLWEIQIKLAIGKLEMDVSLAQIVREQLQGHRFQLLDIRAEHQKFFVDMLVAAVDVIEAGDFGGAFGR